MKRLTLHRIASSLHRFISSAAKLWKEARRLATESAKKRAHDGQRKTPEAKVLTVNVEVPRRLPKKCRYAEMLGW
jgi:hypothetical protein